MLGIFKRSNWLPESIAEIRGKYRDLQVTLRGLPCLKEDQGTKRKYAYPDFGFEFLTALHDQLGHPEMLAARLNTGATAHALVTLRTYSPISVELCGKPDPKAAQFESDIADALLEAFKSVDLRPN